MDNASYHSTLAEKLPNSKSKKADIQNWLQIHGITYDPSVTRTELLKLIEPYKCREKSYELDRIANEMRHEVIRLPPYHCQYNPIELIWARVKGEVADRNSTFRLADVEQLMHTALDNITAEIWLSCVQHAEKLQEEDFEKEVLRDEVLERIIVNLGPDSDNSDSELSEEEGGEEEGEGEEDEPLATPLY
ncbi:hypothetical protein C0J52_25298 [Blattella germanica]|nr:hypothetical protein C0J52_25298 [Blattella germanica]